MERRLRRERLLSSLLTVFAGVTVFICCLGIYGMLAYAVERRRQEISVRMAIGAQTRDVVRLMVRESLVPVASGVVAGAGLSIAANRWLSQVLYGVSSYDPLTLVGASVLFLTGRRCRSRAAVASGGAGQSSAGVAAVTSWPSSSRASSSR